MFLLTQVCTLLQHFGNRMCLHRSSVEWQSICLTSHLTQSTSFRGWGTNREGLPKPLSARNSDNAAAGSHHTAITQGQNIYKEETMKHTIGLILNKRKHKQQKQQKTQTMPDMITFYDGWSGYTMALFSFLTPGATRGRSKKANVVAVQKLVIKLVACTISWTLGVLGTLIIWQCLPLTVRLLLHLFARNSLSSAHKYNVWKLWRNTRRVVHNWCK